MRLVIDNTARFFSVVGAPYIVERHLENSDADLDPPAPRTWPFLAALPRSSAVGSWLQDDH